jgi:drug/metabolite transporter (DMT)-like permease
MTFNRTAPLAGIPAVMLIVAGAIAAGDTPKPDAPVDELVSFYTEHDTGQVASGVLLSLGAIFFLVFSAALIDSIRRAGANSRTASALCLGGGVLFAGGLALAGGSAYSSGTSPATSTPPRCRRCTSSASSWSSPGQSAHVRFFSVPEPPFRRPGC